MANRNFPSQRQFSFHLLPVKLDFSMSVTGSSGALGATANPGLGITSITRLSAGIYQLQLQDNYAGFLDASFDVKANYGATAAASAAAAGTVYRITSVGTTPQAQWVAAGLPSGLTAATGQVFLAAAAASAATGTGNIAAVSASNIIGVSIIGAVTPMLSNQPFNAGSGGYVTFGCVAPTAASAATPVFTDPAANTVITGSIFLNNSAVQ